jgi:hypothetical protein
MPTSVNITFGSPQQKSTVLANNIKYGGQQISQGLKQGCGAQTSCFISGSDLKKV